MENRKNASSFPMERLSPILAEQGSSRDRIETTDIFNSSPPSTLDSRIEDANSPPPHPTEPHHRQLPDVLSKGAEFCSAASLLLANVQTTPATTLRGCARGRRLKSRKFTPSAPLVLTTRAKLCQKVESRQRTASGSSERVLDVEIDTVDSPKRQSSPGSVRATQIKDDSPSDTEDAQDSVPVIHESPEKPMKISLKIRHESSSPESVITEAQEPINKFETPSKNSSKDTPKPEISFETPEKANESKEKNVEDIAVFHSTSESDSSQNNDPHPPPPLREDPEGTIFQESELPRRFSKGPALDLLKHARRVAERVKRDRVLFEYETSTGLRPLDPLSASPELVVSRLWKSGSCFLALCQPRNLQRFNGAPQAVVLILNKLIHGLTPGATVVVHFPVTLVTAPAYKTPFCFTSDKIRVFGFSPYLPIADELFSSSDDVLNSEALRSETFFTLRPKNSTVYFDSIDELIVSQMLLEDYEIALDTLHTSSNHNIYCIDSNEKIIRIHLTHRTNFPDGARVLLRGFHVKDVIQLDTSFSRYILGCETRKTLLFTVEPNGDCAHSIEMTFGVLLPPRKNVVSISEASSERKPGVRRLMEVSGATLQENDLFRVIECDVAVTVKCSSTVAREELLLSAGNNRRTVLDGAFFDQDDVLIVDDLTIIR